MNKISLKLTTRYKSLQEGFEWKDIPTFAVITGVNGVGKTQLLEVIKGRSERPDNRGIIPQIVREIISLNGPENLIFSENTTQRGLTLNGLIEYVKSGEQRLVTLRNLDQQIGALQTHINNKQHQLSQIADKIAILQIESNIRSWREQIWNLREQKLNVNIYAYDEELKRIARKLEKKVEELTEDEIRQFAIDNFESLTNVDELTRFIANENMRYMRRVTYLSETHQREEEDMLVAQERPFQTINRLFRQYGFDYFDMLNPFPHDGKLNGEIRFKGKGGEEVDYNSLSSGEQAIVQFVIWSYGQDFRGNRLNTMVLDEPDAHLHPSMCKMMVEIFSEMSAKKDVGGGGIRIIITTHSPSTVAFTPEGSLFVMQREADNKRVIIPTTTENAVEILSDGIFTFSRAMSNFTLLSSSPKQNLVFVEGKTDVKHFTRAMQVLGYNLDVEFFDMHDASTLSSFISCAPARLFNKKSLIALYDCDKEGEKGYNKGKDFDIAGVKVVTSEQCEGKSFCIKILPPAGLEKYCPVEYLYSKDVLDSNHVLTKRNFTEYINLMGLSTSEDAKALSEEYDNESTLRPFRVNDDRKNAFSEMVQQISDPTVFEGYRPTLDLIDAILSR
ncbi:MAG: ATP-binding protein [Bacteroidaceae bacterium]|nr:ATP-binding protein [Bacteroidaceae bacterium]